jgi:4-amino-4-deoxy-L-arabinose transferase-like glycosyltransferase
MPSNRKIYVALALLLLVSTFIRGFIAGFIELGNDEVYYWTYARYPALSHFDHPLMVGLAIQLFSLDLLFDSEFFIRLAAVVCGTLSTLLMFLIGRQIKDPLTGLYAALLFTASVYGFILTGTFILPDAPQVVFWLLTLFLLIKSLPDRDLKPRSRLFLLLAGATTGLALLSKYHSVFLPTGAFLYMLIYNHRWFRARETWAALGLVLIFCLPVLLWNMENDVISFTFHEDRIKITESGVQIHYFLTELVGEFFYNNPVIVLIILASLLALARGRQFLNPSYRQIILLISVPLILVFISFSLFRSTLPHWTGPGYLGLIMIAAAWLAEPKSTQRKIRLIPWPVAVSLGLLLLVVIVAAGQIRYGFLPLGKYKADDVTHDLTGWQQLGDKFAPIANKYEAGSLMKPGSPLLTFRWFPAANLDYYVCRKINKPLYALGTLERIHKYYWINQIRGDLKQGSDAYYLALSDDYGDPIQLYGPLFDTIIPADTITITRRNDTIRRVFVFRLLDLKEEIVF